MDEVKTREITSDKVEKRRELFLFLFVTFVLFPVLTIVLIGGYGFLVWVYQMIMGPPGPPG